jgi:hypothetical protein
MICTECKTSFTTNVKDYVRDGNKRFEVSNCPCCDTETFEEINET